MAKISAGLLMYRMNNGAPEVFLVHPGGPFHKNKDLGSWDIPKGEVHDGEDLLEAAKREFQEETSFVPVAPFAPLGSVTRNDGKTIHAWAFPGDYDPANMVSNTCEIDWPPRSGKKMTIPEVDRGEYFPLDQARLKMYPTLTPFLDALEKVI